MSFRRTGILLYKEFVQGPKNFMFIFAIIVPIVMTFIVSLLFGSFFSGKPKLGIVDPSDSRFSSQAEEVEGFIVKEYASPDELLNATEIGAVDIGVTLPGNFDQLVLASEPAEVTAYVWGESLIKHRAMLGAAIASWIRGVAGQESPIEIVVTSLGDAANLPIEQRLIPLIVMMSVLVGGVMVPATSMVDETQKGTLRALSITPTTMGDIYTAKATFGVVLATITGILILLLNQSFGINPPLLIFLLILGAIMAAEFGVLLGSLVKDINSLFAVIKAMGLLLYAPAIIYLFPAIPQWIAKVFPTYYMIQPVIEVTQNGAGWSDIAWMVLILVGYIILLGIALAVLARRRRITQT